MIEKKIAIAVVGPIMPNRLFTFAFVQVLNRVAVELKGSFC